MQPNSRSEPVKQLAALAGIMVCLGIMIFGYHTPVSILVSIGLMFIAYVLPGILLAAAIAPDSRVSALLSITGGPILGYAIFKLLALFGIWQYAVASMLAIDVVLIGWILFRNDLRSREFLGRSFKLWATSGFFATLFFLLFGLPWFHFAPNGSLLSYGYFGIDLPFLAGEAASIKHFGALRDLHQSGTVWYYHDLVYTLIAMVSRFSRSDIFVDLAFAFPIVGLSVLIAATRNSIELLTRSRSAAIFVTLLILLSSCLLASDQLPLLLSPSHLIGLALFISLLPALQNLLCGEKLGTSSIAVLVLLIGLAVTKLTSFAAAEILIMLSAIIATANRQSRRGLTLFSIGVAGGLFLILTSHTNALQPTDDFIVGAPLMGYANHLAALLHTSVAAISPVAGPAQVGLKQLLILPYFLFHLLRFLLTDPRSLAVLLGVLFIRKQRLFIVSCLEPRFLLALLITIPAAYALPILYSPRWYPLALSFYGPLMGNVLLAVLCGLLLTLLGKQWNRAGQVLCALLILISVVAGIWHMTPKGKPYQVLSGHRYEILRMIALRSNPSDRILTFRTDYDTRDTLSDESYYLYSALTERSVVSAGASYGSLLGAVATVDSLKGLHQVEAARRALSAARAVTDTMLYSEQVSTILETAHQNSLRYILWDDRTDPSPFVPFQVYSSVTRTSDHLHLYTINQ